MSLIADSLKKAVKEKSAPKWEADPEVNPVAKREPVKRPGLASVFRILLLIVLPTGVFVYLISIGAFSLKDTPVTQKPELPVSAPAEEARVSPPREPAPKVSLEKPVASPSKKPVKKITVEKNPPGKKLLPNRLKKKKPLLKRLFPLAHLRKKPGSPKRRLLFQKLRLRSPRRKKLVRFCPKKPPRLNNRKLKFQIMKLQPDWSLRPSHRWIKL